MISRRAWLVLAVVGVIVLAVWRSQLFTVSAPGETPQLDLDITGSAAPAEAAPPAEQGGQEVEAEIMPPPPAAEVAPAPEAAPAPAQAQGESTVTKKPRL